MLNDQTVQSANFSGVLAPRYDVVVCGAGSSGSVIARRLAENPDVTVRMSVVDGHLRVHGMDHLRVADASIMPRITSGNTMAPCGVIGERAAQFISADYRF